LNKIAKRSSKASLIAELSVAAKKASTAIVVLSDAGVGEPH
jgi:hypothetical protein